MTIVNIKGNLVANNEQSIYEWFGVEFTSPRIVDEQIAKAKGGDIEVIINSPGGSVYAGSEIYTTLKSYPSNVTVKIIYAASAASVVAMAGKTILMSPTGSMMIHNVSTNAGGDYRDMEHMAEVLKNYNKTIANAYRIRTGIREEDLLKLMDQETYFTAQQALSYKFIDGIMFEGKYSEKAQAQEQFDKLKKGSANNGLEKAQAQLTLLKLKGARKHE